MATQPWLSLPTGSWTRSSRIGLRNDVESQKSLLLLQVFSKTQDFVALLIMAYFQSSAITHEFSVSGTSLITH
jgi:hypothetical protein